MTSPSPADEAEARRIADKIVGYWGGEMCARLYPGDAAKIIAAALARVRAEERAKNVPVLVDVFDNPAYDHGRQTAFKQAADIVRAKYDDLARRAYPAPKLLLEIEATIRARGEGSSMAHTVSIGPGQHRKLVDQGGVRHDLPPDTSDQTKK